MRLGTIRLTELERLVVGIDMGRNFGVDWEGMGDTGSRTLVQRWLERMAGKEYLIEAVLQIEYCSAEEWVLSEEK